MCPDCCLCVCTEEAASYAKKAVKALTGVLGKDHAALEPFWQALADLSAKVSCDLLSGLLFLCLPSCASVRSDTASYDMLCIV